MLIGNGRLITRNEAKPFFENGAVYIEGTKIKGYGETAEMQAKYPNEQFIDACGNVIMPGLINTHHHIYSAFARGLNLGISPKNFGEVLEGMWWRIDKALNLDDVKYSAYATFADSIKNGVTTVFDHHASAYSVTNSLFTIADVANELGVRGCFCYEVSDRDGEKIADEGIEENVNFIKHAKENNGGMTAGMFGLHAAFTLSDKTLEKAVAKKPDYAGFHIHAAEGVEDVKFNTEKYGKRVIERLNDSGILGENTIAVHCIHVDDNEIELLKKTNTIVVHNPESNMGNAVGCAKILKLMEQGVLTGLGTDGYTSDMLESMKVANIFQKHNEQNPSVAWGEVPQMLFENNRAITEKYFGNVGKIKEDYAADVIIVEYDPLTPLNETNINSHILFGMSGRCTLTSVINGKVVMRDRKLLTADEAEIFAKSRELSQKLWARV